MNINRETLIQRSGFPELNFMQEEMLRTPFKRLALLAPTGSGKTVAFLIALLRNIKKPSEKLQAIVLAPSRELALQITSVIKKLAPEYKTLAVYGGHPLKDELNAITSSVPDILIATPGRLLDHMSRESLDFTNVTALVIDEMDKCLELGFLPDIKKILRRLPRTEFFMLTSATLPAEEDIMKTIAKEAVIDFTRDDKTAKPDIEVVEIPSVSKDKLDTLENLLGNVIHDGKTIVFSNHRDSAERINNRLRQDGFPAALYHGGLEQEQRELALVTLRNGTTPVLVATDLAGRGLDIPEVENVVHYHMPVSQETFVHRNGRTARAGASGYVYVITNEEENLPDYIQFDRKWNPSHFEGEMPVTPATLLFNIGKKEKISRGDILGFLVKQGGIEPSQVGKIDVADHYSSVTLPKHAVSELLPRLKGLRLKSHRFLPTILS